MKLRLTVALAAVGLAALCGSVFAQPVMAHGFGERYDLPLPLRFFLMAGAAAVVLSFVISAVFLRGGATHRGYPRYNLLRIAPVRWLASPWSLAIVRTISVALTVYVIFGGFFGSERAALNPAPAAVYVAFWVALSFFTAIIGNLWALVNPWKIAWGFLAQVAGSVQPGALARPQLVYPARWGLWPALLVFLGFAILETVIAGGAGPRALAWILVIYTVYIFLGMYLFGRDVWLRNAEGFTVVYGFMARFAITEVSVARSICVACSSDGGCAADAGDCVDCYECYALAQPLQRRFNLRPPGVGLNRIGAVTLPGVCAVILLLSTVSFDGLSATPEWLSFSTWFHIADAVLRRLHRQSQRRARSAGPVRSVVRGHLRVDGAVIGPGPTGGAAAGAGVRVFVAADCPGLSFRPLPGVFIHQWPAVHCAGVRPVWLGVGSVRHGRGDHKHRYPVALIHLVFLDRSYRYRTHCRGLSGPRSGGAIVRGTAAGAAEPATNAGADGMLHLREFVDYFTPHRSVIRAGWSEGTAG